MNDETLEVAVMFFNRPEMIFKHLHEQLLRRCKGNVPQGLAGEVWDVFHGAYENHKRLFGSYRDLTGQEYVDAMSKRYQYMYHAAMEFIEKLDKEE